jgi:restriction endonuclease S subunit
VSDGYLMGGRTEFYASSKEYYNRREKYQNDYIFDTIQKPFDCSIPFNEYCDLCMIWDYSLLCDKPDYNGESIIIGTMGSANINYDTSFSTSIHCAVLQLKNPELILTKYVYYYLLNNIHLLQDGFSGINTKYLPKLYISNIKIPIPLLEKQQQIIDLYNDTEKMKNQTHIQKIMVDKQCDLYSLNNKLKIEYILYN